jgi:uncharacterized protein (DUF4415 family)
MKGDAMKENYDFSQAKRGAVVSGSGKTRITIHIDTDVLDVFRAEAATAGKGYQTLINEALRRAMLASEPLTLDSVRRVIREELRAA